jgi:hypothetical protein
MMPDRDIWRAANLLIREHGAEAEVVSARRADEMLEGGDRDGQLVLRGRARKAASFPPLKSAPEPPAPKAPVTGGGCGVALS